MDTPNVIKMELQGAALLQNVFPDNPTESSFDIQCGLFSTFDQVLKLLAGKRKNYYGPLE